MRSAGKLARWTASIAFVCSVASTLVGAQQASASSVGGASATPASSIGATVVYKCRIASALTQSLDTVIHETAPAWVLSGKKLSLTHLQVSVVLPASLVNLLIEFEHVTSLTGALTTIDFHASGATPATLNAPPASGWGFNVPVTKNKAATITVPRSPANLGPFTTARRGTVSIKPGNFKMTTKFGDIVCTAPSAIPAAAIARIPILAVKRTSAERGQSLNDRH